MRPRCATATVNESENRPCPTGPEPLHLAVALDGAGWHPAAWREPDARPDGAVHRRLLGRPGRRGRARPARLRHHRGRASACSPTTVSRPTTRTDQVRGRLDAVLIAARVAPLTRHIGLVPTAVVTHTEPFHLSKAIATLDYVSTGRAGVRVQVSAEPRRRRTSAGAHSRLPRATSPNRTCTRWSPSCSTRPRTTSRWCAGSGTAGRTTPRSATSPPAASSTGTSCTTSTSRAARSRSRARRSRRGRRRASRRRRARPTATLPYRLAARSADVGFVTPHDAADAPRDRRARSRGERRGGPADTAARLRRPRGVPRRRRRAAGARARHRLDELRRRRLHQRRTGVRRHAGELADLLAGVARGRRRPASGCARRAPARPDADHRRRWCPSCSAAALFRTAYEAARCAGCSACRAPPTATHRLTSEEPR